MDSKIRMPGVFSDPRFLYNLASAERINAYSAWQNMRMQYVGELATSGSDIVILKYRQRYEVAKDDADRLWRQLPAHIQEWILEERGRILSSDSVSPLTDDVEHRIRQQER